MDDEPPNFKDDPGYYLGRTLTWVDCGNCGGKGYRTRTAGLKRLGRVKCHMCNGKGGRGVINEPKRNRPSSEA